MEQIFDPLRKKSVPLTPEERVRQWFIALLRDACRVPVSHMLSEYAFCLGSKQMRADIMLWDDHGGYLAVVECKRPEVKLDAAVLDQAVRYNLALGLKYLMLTNGTGTMVLKNEGGTFVPADEIPSYERMLSE